MVAAVLRVEVTGGWPTLSLISTPEGAPFLSRFLRRGGDFDFLSPPASGPVYPFKTQEGAPSKLRLGGGPSIFFELSQPAGRTN